MTIKCSRYGCNYAIGSIQQRNCSHCPHNPKPVDRVVLCQSDGEARATSTARTTPLESDADEGKYNDDGER